MATRAGFVPSALTLLMIACLLTGCGDGPTGESSTLLLGGAEGETPAPTSPDTAPTTPPPTPPTPPPTPAPTASPRVITTAEGTPGAPWTEAEIDAIKNTLWIFFSQSRGGFESQSCRLLGDGEYPCFLERLETGVWEECDSENASDAARRDRINCDGSYKLMAQGAIPSQAKFMRLGFHDCFKYTDGTGGCDGCLNFSKLFVVKNMDERAMDGQGGRKADFSYDFLNSSNTNLAATADILEEVYTNHNYGYQRDHLTESIQQTGKSRADLWAFATILVIDWFFDQNQHFCDSEDPEHIHLYKEPTMGLPYPCRINQTRPMNFYSGRRDCPESYKPAPEDRWREYESGKWEVTANPHATGPETVEFMRAQFDFTPRETVAVMGAHAVGTFTSTNAGFRYTWMGRELGQARMLNNLYYRVLAFRPLYLQPDMEAIQVMKANDEPVPGPSAIWYTMRPRNLCPGYGPVQWHMHVQPEPGSGFYNGDTHVTMLNCDIGLYLAFDVTSGGYPTQGSGTCSMLRTSANSNHQQIYEDAVHQDCLQTDTVGGVQPLYEMVEEYANDQDLWWNEFVVVIERMLSNGYAEGELLNQGPIRTTTTTTPLPPIEECTSNYCCLGIRRRGICCPHACGQCGGGGCRSAPGGEALCCSPAIEESGVMCETQSDTACMIP